MSKRIAARVKKCVGVALCAALLSLYGSEGMRQLRALPETVHVSGQEGDASPLSGLSERWFAPADGVVSVSSSADERLENVASSTVTYRLFGVIPLKSVRVVRSEPVYLVPGGMAVGITIRTQGVLVVGLGTVDTEDGLLSPGAAAGIRAGDVIVAAGGETLKNADHLMQLTRASDGELPLTISRDGERVETTIRLVRDARDDALRIGLWVRDSTAGVGTLSFYEPDTGWFAALGHAVSDIDTQSELTVREGRIIPTEIIGVKRGEQGSPGELIGAFSISDPAMGQILKNSEYGIYGKMDRSITGGLYPQTPMAYGYEARTGKAKLLATIDGDEVEAFDCEIIRVNAQSSAATKGMVVSVTDERLLSVTGGIVQGMSGCPIIQNEKLIGIVTHVFVNDPTRGYCVYAEWMREQILEATG